MNFNISNALVEYTPSLPVNTQKLLMIIMGNTTKEDFIEAMKNKSSVNVKINKTDLFQIFGNIHSKNTRRDFYICKKHLHDIIKINTTEEYIETVIVAGTSEGKRNNTISFEIPYHLFSWQIDYKTGKYSEISILDLSKLKKRYSLILYQYFKTKIFQRRFSITPMEFNQLMNTNMNPGAIFKILKDTRDEYGKKSINIDYSIVTEKEKNRIIKFNIEFVFNESLEDYDNHLKNEVSILISSINNYNEGNKFLFIINKLNGLKSSQISRIFEHFTPFESINDKIAKKIILHCGSEKKSDYFYNIIIASILSFTPSKLSKTIDVAAVELKRGRIDLPTSFIVSRLKRMNSENNPIKKKVLTVS